MATIRRGKAKAPPRTRAPSGKLVKRRPAKRSPKMKSSRESTQPSLVETALAAFAHDVRTPLTGILAVSDLLATSDLGEREHGWVATIKAGAEHLASLATLFVDAARHDNAVPRLREEFFDLRALTRMAGESLNGRATAKNLRATSALPDGLPRFVIGDGVRLRAALENLIDNAVKFTDAGEVSLAVAFKRIRGKIVAVTFVVGDSGIGLTIAEIKRLFKPFSQANVTIAARFGGAGLGLSSARQVARAMGGDISAAARRGGGAAFTMTVRLREAEMPSDDTGGGGAADRTTALRVLSVEDNPFGRVVLKAILTELGHACEFAGSGEAALDRLAAGGFDAVLMDMVLPGIGGVETIGRLRASAGPRLAVIGLSGRETDKQAALAAGADAFLVKPVSPRALALELHHAVALASAR